MRDRGFIAGVAILVTLGGAAVLAPWLGLADPIAQPDGLVLRELPPMSSRDALVLSDGSLRYVDEWSVDPDGGVRYRRGTTWKRLAPDRLAGADPSDYRVRTFFPLGTDGFGRDMLSRMVYGARVSLMVGVLATAVALLLGTVVGLASGLLGRWTDAALMRFTDVVLSIPRLFLALLLVTLYGASLPTTVLVLGATTWMAAARLVRGEVLSLRERDFVRAARASGAGPVRQALYHLLPGASVPLLVEATLQVGVTILLEASLSFLGLGVPAPTPSWGNLIADGQHRLLDAWWIATFPGIAIVLTVVALNLVGDRARRRTEA